MPRLPSLPQVARAIHAATASRVVPVAPSLAATMVAPLAATLAVGAFVTPLAAQGTPPAPPARIQAVMKRPEFAHAHFGMEFYDVKAKKTVFAWNGQQLFVPGSTTKVPTMATAIETLGADYRFRTRIYRTGPVKDGVLDGDLVLVASGDPNLSGRDTPDGRYAFIDHDHSYGGMPVAGDQLATVRKLARQVAAKGIRRVTGQVIVDATLFNEGDRELGTGIVLSPVVINDNVIDLVVTPGAKAGDVARVDVSPKTSYLTVQANLVTSDSGSAEEIRFVEDSTDKDHRTLVVTGSVPRGEPSNPRWRVPSPSRFGEVVLTEALAEAGVQAIPRLASRTVDFTKLAAGYDDASMVAEHVSLPITKEAVVLLKTSQNLHASNFPLILGATAAARQAKKSGFDIAHDWFAREGLDLNGAVQGDGAGGDAFFAPAFMSRLLAVVASRPWYAEFRNALPILGRDGTLADIQKNAPGAGKVFAKTGTFAGYDPLNKRLVVHGKGLAGFFTTASGREISFAIYVNNVAADKDPATMAGQALGEIASLAWESIK